MSQQSSYSELSQAAALVLPASPGPHPSPMGDIFNLIKACQRYWFWHFQLRPSLLWALLAEDLLICDEGALSAVDHMDEEPLCLPYGPVLSAADTDAWLLLQSLSPPANHN